MKNWLYILVISLAVFGCEKPAHPTDCTLKLDSTQHACDLRFASIEKDLVAAKQRLDSLEVQCRLLADSLVLLRKGQIKPVSTIRFEPKGDPIRKGDPVRKGN